MATDDSYNGWSNYETWCVSLWLSNDEGLYNETRALAASVAEWNEPDADRFALTRGLGDELQAFCESFESVEQIQSQASFVSDLFGRAWGRVEWFEIAENLLSELAEA